MEPYLKQLSCLSFLRTAIYSICYVYPCSIKLIKSKILKLRCSLRVLLINARARYQGTCIKSLTYVKIL